MKSVSIQGKPYITVNERLKEFRENYGGYSLVTDLVEVNERHALIKASILDKEGRVIAQGTAFEVAGSSFINKGSFVENAETSAWGRALGNFGIGIDTSVATADEVANAVLNQQKPLKKVKNEDSLPATTEQIAAIEILADVLGGTSQKVFDTWSGGKIPTYHLANVIIQELEKKKKTLSKDLDNKAL